MLVADLRHFLDLPDDASAPAQKLAVHLSRVVRAATAGEPDNTWTTAVACIRRPGRRPCAGHIKVFRSVRSPSIDWQCDVCGDAGAISGWEDSHFDLRERGATPDAGEEKAVRLAEASAQALLELELLDSAVERAVWAHERKDRRGGPRD